jgi:glycosyltransferase involved in cell wall biosynthesis
MLASTLDLTLLEPDVEWLPSPFDISELEDIYETNCLPADAIRPIRIAHAPTARQVKSTDVVLAAISQLANDGLPVVLDLIERQTHAVTLAKKAKADILIDQLKLGYGNNAIEAWGMGIPVIAGVQDPRLREAMWERWGYLPFYEATERNLAQRLAELVVDRERRERWGSIGKQHVVTYHNDRSVAAQLAVEYRAALERANNG